MILLSSKRDIKQEKLLAISANDFDLGTVNEQTAQDKFQKFRNKHKSLKD